MKVYDIEFSGIDLSNHHDYVLAESFPKAYQKAITLLESYRKEVSEEAQLVKIEFEEEITEVKE